MKKIFIVTNTLDPHVDSVIRNIKDKESVFRFNTDELLNAFGFEFFVNDLDGSSNFNNPINQIIETSNISCIYYRRPEKPIINDLRPLSNVSIDEAWHGFYHVLYDLYDKPWLGHPHRDKYASSRAVQLTTAKKVGWKIPPTIISKDPHLIKEFAKKHHNLAIKPLGEKGVIIEENWCPYFTSRISHNDILENSDKEIASTYNYLQKYIEKKNEWRITVIGNEVFPCIIHSQNSEVGKTDWRTVDYNSIEHERGDISDEFRNQLIQFLKYLGLPFGAFDFILTPQNEFIFLECNPNGQWLWIEELTGMKISLSIANWLENNNK